ncbi:MAG: hydrogenase maturation nickel metallochaperone HypA [Bacteroidales bacterium]|nr:hydrogenase maturation nickel metallochaperone HypA [Bacteroidales bacterium]
MHELSIAMQIVEIVEEEARKHDSAQVSAVHLEIGTLSGVEPDALKFAMEEAVRHSMAAKADIFYHFIEAVAVCEECCHEFKTQDYFKVCPYCNSINTGFLKGKELKIKSIDIQTN